MSDRVDFLNGLLAPLAAQLEQDPAGEAPAGWDDLGAVMAAYLEGRCGRAEALRAAAAYRARRPVPADLLEAVRSAG
ncbi:hypothetical protein KNO81_12275 [Paraburkholderia sediminicola]|nr:hypothetical protein [Paraburkholderia sediminicola]